MIKDMTDSMETIVRYTYNLAKDRNTGMYAMSTLAGVDGPSMVYFRRNHDYNRHSGKVKLNGAKIADLLLMSNLLDALLSDDG